MSLTYFKRFRMEIDLSSLARGEPRLPPGYRLVAWNPGLLDVHAETKYLSFRSEIDANVFPCLGDSEGCSRLMREISHKDGFLAEATWLAAYDPSRGQRQDSDATYAGQLTSPYRIADADDDEAIEFRTRFSRDGRLDESGTEFCGTIQGIRDRSGLGAIQNLGIVPEHRGRGLGTGLLLKALDGFRRVGLRRAFLEVTAQNDGAIKLYRRLGFSKARTVYKAIDVATFVGR